MDSGSGQTEIKRRIRFMRGDSSGQSRQVGRSTTS